MMDNNNKTALIVEGGGLRGCYAVGVLKKLYEYGGPDQFDAIYAVSSGVFAATYFAAGQVDEMENTWRDLVHGSHLVDYLNIFRGEPVLKLDYLIELFKGMVRLDFQRVFESKPTITYALTEWETGLPKYMNAKRLEIFDLMRASSALPCVYPKSIIIDGIRYLDGGIADPIPIKKAIDDGFSNILVILTRPKGFVKKANSTVIAKLCLRGSPPLQEAFCNAYRLYNEALRIIDNCGPDVNIIAIRPHHLAVTRLTRERSKIIDGIELGKRDAEMVFSTIANELTS